MTHASPLADLGRTAAEAAARAARISMEGAERALKVQIDYARGAVEQASLNARAVAQARDAQELLALRARMAEDAFENLVGYSRSLYEVASTAQSQYSRLAEERLARFQQAVSEGVEQAAKAAPAGSDVAVAAVKSQLAAATAAFDTFTKAAKNFAAYADAGLSASRPARRK